jgi:teichuronic acid biosynthesis glycosyltransferase TuaG
MPDRVEPVHERRKQGESDLANPFVSVIVACYNDVEYLPEALGSVVEQTASTWEVMVVDDGSTTGDVTAVVRSFADERIKLIRHERNLGPAVARNTAVRNSTGDLVTILDSDDRLGREYVEKSTRFMAAHPDCTVVFPDYYRFGNEKVYNENPLLDIEALLQEQWIPFPGSMMRRKVWEAIGGYWEDQDLWLNEDWDFWLSAFELGLLEVGHIPEPLYWYRERANSLSSRLRPSEWRSRELMSARHRALYRKSRVRRAFLSEGYWRSARATFQRGDALPAFRLAAKGLRLAPRRSLTLIVRRARRRRATRPPTGTEVPMPETTVSVGKSPET